jgi:DNA-directed RNA polymerase subunit RPC12/RpoP
MTRFCIRCNRIIGEKCVRCGMEAIANSNGRALATADFDCPSCAHHFLQGDGGQTGGMCEPCFDVELQKARGLMAKTQVKHEGPESPTQKSLVSRRPVRFRSVANATSSAVS